MLGELGEVGGLGCFIVFRGNLYRGSLSLVFFFTVFGFFVIFTLLDFLYGFLGDFLGVYRGWVRFFRLIEGIDFYS